MNVHLQAPQMIVLALLLIECGYAISTHKKPCEKADERDCRGTILKATIYLALLYCGGFFS